MATKRTLSANQRALLDAAKKQPQDTTKSVQPVGAPVNVNSPPPATPAPAASGAVPYKYYKTNEGGQTNVTILPGTNTPYGYSEIDYNEFKKYASRTGRLNPDGTPADPSMVGKYGDNSNFWGDPGSSQYDKLLADPKYASVIQAAEKGQSSSSGMVQAIDPISGQMNWMNKDVADSFAKMTPGQIQEQKTLATQMQTQAKIPAGWDAQTYANFKAANPNLEPDAEDTARMQAAGGKRKLSSTQQALLDNAKKQQQQDPMAGGGKGTPLDNPSVVDFLTSMGMPSDYNSRSNLARENGITNYTGSAAQNTRLLGLLREQATAGTKPAQGGVQSTKTTDNNQGNAKTPQEEIDAINAEANRIQEEEAAKIAGQGSSDLSGSADLVKKLVKTLETKAAEPPAKTLQQQFLDKRKELGIDPLETSLAGVDADIKKLDADFSSLMPEEDNRRVSVRAIRQRQSAEELQYQRQRRDLLAERDSIASQVNQKYSVLNTMVTLAGQDINNAQQDYQTRFSQNLSLINAMKGIEDSAKSNSEKLQDNARANLQIMSGLLKGGNLMYEDLPASTQADIKNMELRAGLPVGVTEFITKAVKDPVQHYGTAFIDSSGNRIQPIITTDEYGNPQTYNLNLGKQGAAPKAGTTNGGKTSTSTPKSTTPAFTATEKKKLEQAGLLKAPRQQQLDYLYKKKPVSSTKDSDL